MQIKIVAASQRMKVVSGVNVNANSLPKTAYVGFGMPDGKTWIELIKSYTPSDGEDIQQTFANRLGIRHIAFTVE